MLLMVYKDILISLSLTIEGGNSIVTFKETTWIHANMGNGFLIEQINWINCVLCALYIKPNVHGGKFKHNIVAVSLTN